MKNKTTKTIACVIAGLTLTACVGSVNVLPKTEDGADVNTANNENNENKVNNKNKVNNENNVIISRFSDAGNNNSPIVIGGSSGRGGSVGGVSTSSAITVSQHWLGSIYDDGTISFEIDAVASETQNDVSLRSNGNTLALTINGIQHILTSNDGSNVYNVEQGPRLWYAYGLPKDIKIPQVINGTHETVQGIYVFYDAEEFYYVEGKTSYPIDHTRGYATAGIRTSASVVESQTAMATYSGDISIELLPKKLIAYASIWHKRGTLSMNVDFGANRVAGTATFDEGTATFASAPINSNGNVSFAGEITLDSALRTDAGLTDNPTGSYAGNFFGPNADDLAGVISINSTNADGVVLGYGGFRADREDN